MVSPAAQRDSMKAKISADNSEIERTTLEVQQLQQEITRLERQGDRTPSPSKDGERR